MIFKNILRTVTFILNGNTHRIGRAVPRGKVIRVAANGRRAGAARIVAKWSRNTVSGRLECRWTVSCTKDLSDCHRTEESAAYFPAQIARL